MSKEIVWTCCALCNKKGWLDFIFPICDNCDLKKYFDDLAIKCKNWQKDILAEKENMQILKHEETGGGVL